MSAIRLALTAASLAVTAARHPLVRAGLRAAAMNPAAKAKALDTAKRAAYAAGVVAGRLLPKAK
jgi:hypothetical protein